jgi:hypothetical protein
MRYRQAGFLIALFSIAALRAGAAAAESYLVDGIPMALSLSPGLCPLSRDDPNAVEAYASQDRIHAANNTVIVIAVPCAGQTKLDPTTYAIWLVTGPKGRTTVVPEAYSRADIIGQLSSASETFDFTAASRAQHRR